MLGLRNVDAGNDHLRRSNVRGRGLLREQVAEHELAGIELVRVEPASRAAEEGAVAAGIRGADGDRLRQGALKPAFQF